ncbi:hypothetical protein [Coleofasciculus sp. E2-BRE-01]|uniref:hypothetical protein n=1 Tax=Coleofasciculus sp. E2-BRE-01 TaxID=3069524 RepID=UPI0033014B4B
MLDSLNFIGFGVFGGTQMFSPEKLCDFINQIQEEGYKVVDGFAFPFDSPRNIISNSEEIVDRVLNSCRENYSTISEHFWKYPFEFIYSINSEDAPGWTLSTPVDTLIGVNRDLGEHNSLEFLKILRKTLEYYPIYYGCGFSDEAPDISSVDLDTNFEVAEVCEINFYSSTYIEEHLDREHLLSAPAWCVEELANGVLLIPSLRAIYTDDPDSLDTVNQHLGWA